MNKFGIRIYLNKPNAVSLMEQTVYHKTKSHISILSIIKMKYKSLDVFDRMVTSFMRLVST
jgi:hypothetical protein